MFVANPAVSHRCIKALDQLSLGQDELTNQLDYITTSTTGTEADVIAAIRAAVTAMERRLYSALVEVRDTSCPSCRDLAAFTNRPVADCVNCRA